MPEERYDAIARLLHTKKNIIIAGAPGVGKTYAVKRLAYSMMGLRTPHIVMLIQFHQSYSYEDSSRVPALRRGVRAGQGCLLLLLQEAADVRNAYFFIIDEIPAAATSPDLRRAVLIEAINADRRDKLQPLLASSSTLPRSVHYQHDDTADHSLAMLIHALHRRFAFVELRPAFGSDGFRGAPASVIRGSGALVREVESLNGCDRR